MLSEWIAAESYPIIFKQKSTESAATEIGLRSFSRRDFCSFPAVVL